MAPMMRRPRLPYVQEFKDRHGKVRRYFRRPGFKPLPLPGLPGSTEFQEAYRAALDGAGGKIEIGIDRSAPGSVAAAVASYIASAAFVALADETRRTRRNILERFREKHGDKRIAKLEPHHIQKMVLDKAATPSGARNFLNTLRALMQHCLLVRLIKIDPTIGVKRIKIKTDGYATWSEDDIAKFEKRHAIGTKARLALGLLLFTAQRRGDVIRMGRQHVDNGLIRVKQSKTGINLQIPIHTDLQVILDKTPSEHLTFLTTAYGQPFTAAGFTNWFRERCNEAEIPNGLSAHGLRKAACRRLAEAGCSANVIGSISGHVSLRELQRYTAAADQKRMAATGMATVTKAFPTGSGTSSVKPKRKV
ncbi:tyrosine-type recombinase/integrase [Dongia sp.]|uniref:tyrosine-type recombinase/integrase n=1 Tax=Dongia sp. TaxID=1977262 RepID=UPI0035B1E493